MINNFFMSFIKFCINNCQSFSSTQQIVWRKKCSEQYWAGERTSQVWVCLQSKIVQEYLGIKLSYIWIYYIHFIFPKWLGIYFFSKTEQTVSTIMNWYLWTFYLIIEKSTFFSSTSSRFIQIDQMLGHKNIFYIFQVIEILQSMFSGHDRIRLII